MGWLFHPVPAARYHDRNAEIDRIFVSSNPDLVTYEILQRSWSGNTCYVACQISNHEKKTSQVVGFVILTKSYTEDGTRWWGYKDMDEDMGPYESKAPRSLIKRLSPTTNEQALAWRERCLNRTRTKRLTKFRTKEPVKFGSFTAQEFEKVKLHRRRGVYRDLATGQLVRLPSWRLEGATPL